MDQFENETNALYPTYPTFKESTVVYWGGGLASAPLQSEKIANEHNRQSQAVSQA